MRAKKAVIAMAGRGIRHFPATRICDKAFFPVAGPDGVVRALFHHQLRDLWEAGFEEVALVLRPDQKAAVQRYLEPPDEALRRRLERHPALLAEVPEMAAMLERLVFIEQPEALGFAHAVSSARSFVEGEPFLLVTGDLLFRGPCYRELQQAVSNSGGRSVSGVCPIGPEDLHGYGTIAGRRLETNSRLLEITALIEKPTPEVARERLHVAGLPPETWLGWFGLHALTPGIFDVLDELLEAPARPNEEVPLTLAQELLRRREGYLALEMSGSKRFDFGLPERLGAAMAGFAQG